ncbi:thioredoxin [Desulfothermobacter acidiphilus]|uniref:thioredoxin n=1 Tax=Desulfothermobacter acidiphilus TaxID=1938353 RepID=UPI003F8A3213
MVLEVNERNFEAEVLQSNLLVMVDFWAPWCGPCQSMAPVVEEVAQEYAGRLKVAKLNVDQNMSLAQRYGIRGIPTLLFFRGGKVIAQEVGYTPKESLVSMVNRLLGEEG